MYGLMIRKEVEKIFFKIAKKNPKNLEFIRKKIEEIRNSPQHYKNLKSPMQHLKRVQIGPYVLTFSVDENTKIVTIEDFDHHDKIYQ
ncbi:MAG: type II toxin-antitoxin system RelE/ParE family toxin [Candidatus Pacearchaeota archaeon]|nr:type II toxin-antitoxin system RelE/ParE family toxin [Candidatus Pacearchaeota archaeon]